MTTDKQFKRLFCSKTKCAVPHSIFRDGCLCVRLCVWGWGRGSAKYTFQTRTKFTSIGNIILLYSFYDNTIVKLEQCWIYIDHNHCLQI